MIPVRLHQRPAFRAMILGVVLGALWVFDALVLGGWRSALAGLLLDLLMLFMLVQASIFFFAQFTLPVKGLVDRLRVSRRAWLQARNTHVAALFVRNGRKVERRGEWARRGPGVAWIDSASAVVARDTTGHLQVLGPGIHFLESDQRIENTYSLHTQTHSIGPGQAERVFERLGEDASEEARLRHAATQLQRQMVSGLTRDGHEVVPEIRVTFKLDAKPAGPGRPGSRFGFSPEAVERAARSEGVNVDPATAKSSQVAWNQLPGLIAVDLWREHLAKFTLDELFSLQFESVPYVLQPQERAPMTPHIAATFEARGNWPARFVHGLNESIERWMTRHGIPTFDPVSENGQRKNLPGLRQTPGRMYTALEVVGHMMKARLMQAEVPKMDDRGRYLTGHVASEEYKRIRERGLHILDVSVTGLRFDPAVEAQIVQQWRSSWHTMATSDRGRVEQLEVLAAESGKQRALLEHAAVLSRAVTAEPVPSIPATLTTLLRATRGELLADERLHGRGSALTDQLEDLARWVESPSDE